MDDKTNLALTLILSFIIGLMLGAGNRVTAESNGRAPKTGNSNAIDVMLLVFWAIALIYMLAIVWHVKLFSLVFFVTIAAAFFGTSCGSKLASERNQLPVKLLLFSAGGGIPLIFHFLLS